MKVGGEDFLVIWHILNIPHLLGFSRESVGHINFINFLLGHIYVFSFQLFQFAFHKSFVAVQRFDHPPYFFTGAVNFQMQVIFTLFGCKWNSFVDVRVSSMILHRRYSLCFVFCNSITTHHVK